MNPEDIKKFESLQDLFVHPGWKVLEEELEFKVESIKEGFTQLGVSDALLAYGQGRISVYREFAGLPSVIDAALEDVKTAPV